MGRPARIHDQLDVTVGDVMKDRVVDQVADQALDQTYIATMTAGASAS